MAKKEYIDRGALLEQLRDYYGCNVECDMKCPVTECAEGRIAMLVPAADVVEVVRCKDCKYSVKYNCKNDACYSFTICRRRDGYSEGVEEDDFCSYGERKEETP